MARSLLSAGSVWLGAAIVGLAVDDTRAQEYLWSVDPARAHLPTGSWFGPCMGAVGDLNGDGIGDLVVRGPMVALDGRTGALLWSAPDPGSIDQFVGLGSDGDGDGVPDFATLDPASWVPHRVDVWSGADGASLLTLLPPGGLRLGTLRATPDLDGDGKRDLAFSDKATGVGVWSSVSGALLLACPPKPTSQPTYGVAIEVIDDLDGDGVEELLVSDRAASNDAGEIDVWSLGTKSLIATLVGANVGDQFGDVMARAGDVDGDGRGDFFVRLRRFGPFSASNGVIQLISGATFGELRRATAPGCRLELEQSIGDFDGDGIVDFIAGGAVCDDWGAGQWVRSGRTMDVLAQVRDEVVDLHPIVFAPAGDLDGDGCDDLFAALDGQVRALRGGPCFLSATKNFYELVGPPGGTWRPGSPPAGPEIDDSLGLTPTFVAAGFAPNSAITIVQDLERGRLRRWQQVAAGVCDANGRFIVTLQRVPPAGRTDFQAWGTTPAGLAIGTPIEPLWYVRQ